MIALTERYFRSFQINVGVRALPKERFNAEVRLPRAINVYCGSGAVHSVEGEKVSNIVSFPKDESGIRALQREGENLVEESRKLSGQITDWEDRFLIQGERYLSSGGNDPTLLSVYYHIKVTREVMGIFL